MSCPRCGADLAGETVCPSCGMSLPEAEAQATTKLEAPETLAVERSQTATMRIPSLAGNRLELLNAAGFAFLTLVFIGALLALAGKLQYSNLGAGADPISILTGIVIAGLGVLGSEIHIGKLAVSATPLGALAVVGLAAVWSVARYVRSSSPKDGLSAMRTGVAFALPFALICWLASLIFRVRSGPTKVAVDGWSILVFALMWGAVFGAVGGAVAYGPRALIRSWLDSFTGERAWIRDATVLAGWALLGLTVLSTSALLLWIIGALLGGGPSGGLGFGGLLAGLIYVLAFAPNLVVSVLTIALGAPVTVGSALTQKGKVIGDLTGYSLFDWAGGGTPWWAILLLLIPAGVGILLGMYAAREGSGRVLPWKTLLLSGGLVAVVIFEVAGLADARLGAGLVRNKGIALAAPQAWAAGLLAFVWVAAGSAAGWFLHRYRRGQPKFGGSEKAVPPSRGGTEY